MRGENQPATREEYERIVNFFGGGREVEIEVAFDQTMPELIGRVMKENAGGVRPSIRQINSRLENMPFYDHEERGLVSEPTIREYTGRVLDRMEYTNHPKNADLFIPKSDARQIADGKAPCEFKPYDDLSRDEKINRLRIALVRKSAINDGQGQYDAATARIDVFEGKASDSHVRKQMGLAAEADGFELRKPGGTERLGVDHRNVTDADLSVVDGGSDGGRATPSKDVEDDPATETAADELDALMNAEPVISGSRM